MNPLPNRPLQPASGTDVVPTIELGPDLVANSVACGRAAWRLGASKVDSRIRNEIPKSSLVAFDSNVLTAFLITNANLGPSL